MSPVTCPICGEPGEHSHGASGVEAVRLLSLHLVSPSRCAACGEPMEYLKQGTSWTCRDPICPQFNVTVSTGVGGVINALDDA